MSDEENKEEQVEENPEPLEVKIIKEKEEIVEEEIDYSDITITEEDKKDEK